MTIQLTAVVDIALTHTADFESALTALAKAAATGPGVLDYGFWRDPTHPGAPAVAGHRSVTVSSLDGGRHA
jgi:quinol monooxygenase YgiN